MEAFTRCLSQNFVADDLQQIGNLLEDGDKLSRNTVVVKRITGTHDE